MKIDTSVLQNDLDKLSSQAVNDAVSATLAWTAAKISNAARQNAPVGATGLLVQSIIPSKINESLWHVTAGQRYAAGLEFGGGHKGEVLTDARLASLQAWVKYKNIETDPVRIHTAAWNIGKKIEAEGVKQQAFMLPALEEVAPQVLDKLKAEIEKRL